jgi:hypothetical protein
MLRGYFLTTPRKAGATVIRIPEVDRVVRSGSEVAPLSPADQEAEARRWVRYHVVGFFATIGVAAGLLIVDRKVSQIIGDSRMPAFRAILLVSVLLAGLGARALLAWRSATVDLQGRIFLAVTGLILLTGAAYGLSDCMQEIREHYKAWEAGRTVSRATMPHDRTNVIARSHLRIVSGRSSES